jgi:superoxide dismutase, Cu-Zn family
MKNIIIFISVLVLIVLGLLVYYYFTANPTTMLKATATLTGTGISGEIYFEEIAEGTHIWGKITGLTAGNHGFAIHEKGDMSKGCDSMGDHYNPTNKSHGPRVINDVETENRHMGDLGNIVVDDKGLALIDFKDKYIQLSGQYSVLGRGIVVYEKADDLGLGSSNQSYFNGNTGKRMACGIIALA